MRQKSGSSEMKWGSLLSPPYFRKRLSQHLMNKDGPFEVQSNPESQEFSKCSYKLKTKNLILPSTPQYKGLITAKEMALISPNVPSKALGFLSAWPLYQSTLLGRLPVQMKSPDTFEVGGLLDCLVGTHSHQRCPSTKLPASRTPCKVRHSLKHLFFNLLWTRGWDRAPEASRSGISRVMLRLATLLPKHTHHYQKLSGWKSRRKVLCCNKKCPITNRGWWNLHNHTMLVKV